MTKLSAISELREKVFSKAKDKFKSFMNAFPPNKNYLWGKHTHIICNELQEAYDRYKQGKSSYVMINIAPRHGKTDLCSRRFPVWLQINDPEIEVILCSYGQDLANDINRDARSCMSEVAPLYGHSLASDRSRLNSWSLDGENGGINAVGLGAAITGRGSSALIIDDFIKNRRDAESELIRDRGWDCFRSDLMTRLAPVHIVIILATRWHVDDISGRIIEEMKTNPKFPKFKVIRIPSQDESTGEYLFPERFSKEYYESQKALLGNYAWQCLHQGDPQARRGNLFNVDNIKIVDTFPKGLRFKRGWDLASSEKQRIKDDPDWTVGVKSAFDKDSRTVYIKHVARIQGEAPQRDKLIEATAKHDGAGVKLAIEQVAGYKDTVTRMQNNLRGFASVESYNPQGDKVTRADPLEPIIDAGNFVLERGEWNDSFLSEFRAFPSGKHDDQVDATVISLGEQLHGVSGGAVIPQGNFGF